jgi:hypothetical protein
LRHQVVLLHDALEHARHLIGAAACAGRDDEFDRAGRLPGRGRRGEPACKRQGAGSGEGTKIREMSL